MKPWPGTKMLDVHRQRAIDHLDPLRRIRRAHRRKHAIEIRLAHEQDLLLRQVDHQVAAGVRAPEEEHLRLHVAQIDDLLVAGHRRRRHDRPRAAPAPACPCAAAAAAAFSLAALAFAASRSSCAREVGWTM